MSERRPAYPAHAPVTDEDKDEDDKPLVRPASRKEPSKEKSDLDTDDEDLLPLVPPRPPPVAPVRKRKGPPVWQDPAAILEHEVPVDRYTCRSYHARAWIKIGVHLCVPHKKNHPLRAMSHTLQHSAPSTGTPSSSFLVPRSQEHHRDLRLFQRGASAELPPPTGYEPNRIFDDQVNMHFTEDDQITELEDRVKSLSYNQSFLPSTYDPADATGSGL